MASADARATEALRELGSGTALFKDWTHASFFISGLQHLVPGSPPAPNGQSPGGAGGHGGHLFFRGSLRSSCLFLTCFFLPGNYVAFSSAGGAGGEGEGCGDRAKGLQRRAIRSENGGGASASTGRGIVDLEGGVHDGHVPTRKEGASTTPSGLSPDRLIYILYTHTYIYIYIIRLLSTSPPPTPQQNIIGETQRQPPPPPPPPTHPHPQKKIIDHSHSA